MARQPAMLGSATSLQAVYKYGNSNPIFDAPLDPLYDSFCSTKQLPALLIQGGQIQ